MGRAKGNRLELVLLAALLAVGSAHAEAQDRETVFIHGILSSGQTWEQAAGRLSSTFQIAPHRPNTSHLQEFQQQANEVAAQVGALPANTLAFAHSQGGIVARQWNRSSQPLAAITTVGTPHLGAPLANNVGNLLAFDWVLRDALMDLAEAFTNEAINCEWWEWIDDCDIIPWIEQQIALSQTIAYLGWSTSLLQILTSVLHSMVAPVTIQERVGSSYLDDLNSSNNLAREHANIPTRVGIVVVAREFFWGGPLRLVFGRDADGWAWWRDFARDVMWYYSWYIYSQMNANHHQLAVASKLNTVAGWLGQIDEMWCKNISVVGASQCWENDAFIPTWSQNYAALGAEFMEIYWGPTHTEETTDQWTEDKFVEVLTVYANVPPRHGPPPPSPPPPHGTNDVLASGDVLWPGQWRTSANGQYDLILQHDGNLVLYQGGTPQWASNTAGTVPGFAAMQGDGNFVLYDGHHAPLRHSGTHWSPGAYLVVQNDGNVVVYNSTGSAIWDRYMCCW